MLSGVPQGTVLGTLLFLIVISDIDKDVRASKLVSFADDNRLYSLYSCVGEVTDCDNLQHTIHIVDLPCRPGFSNSMDDVDCLHGGHYADDLAAN